LNYRWDQNNVETLLWPVDY